VLLSRRAREGIQAGEITLAFRRWRRPTVRAGTRLRTPSGVIAVESVEEIADEDVTDEDARRAGHDSVQRVLASLAHRAGQPLYRVEVRYAGPDPRVALRGRSRIGSRQRAGLDATLRRMDERSHSGPWTIEVLELIAEHPGVLAAELAASRGEETQAFKRRVRRLKELGLTESLEVGYRLSPRGRAYLGRASKAG
jgi:hypothetical protein